ncbi:hypothetical protein L4C31_10720 [Aliivibrio sifiae]
MDFSRFSRFSNLDNIYLWDEENAVLEKFIDYLKWETTKDADESQDEYEDRAEYFIKYDNVFENGESIRNFCIAEGEALGSILKDVDLFEVYESDFSQSEVSLKGVRLIQPLRFWDIFSIDRFLQIPFIAETYANDVKVYNSVRYRALESRRKRRKLLSQAQK